MFWGLAVLARPEPDKTEWHVLLQMSFPDIKKSLLGHEGNCEGFRTPALRMWPPDNAPPEHISTGR